MSVDVDMAEIAQLFIEESLEGLDIMESGLLNKELRELPHYKFVPMLVLTTESGSEMKMEGKAAGATGWIVKPFDPVQLVTTIEKVLS